MNTVELLYERLEKKFGKNEPIFISEILKEMSDYSDTYVYMLLKEADNQGKVVRTLRGVYYIPIDTPIGKSVVGISSIIEKKFLRNGEDVYGIGGRNLLDLNFLVSTQVPYVSELISNRETQKVRVYKVESYTYIIRRSRTTIAKDNYAAYTLCELFNTDEAVTFKKNVDVWDAIKRYIKKENVTKKQIEDIIDYFPKKVKKYIMQCNLYQITL